MVRLSARSYISAINLCSAVEYRLLQHAPVPGALQDAAAVYAHIVTHHLGARKGPDGKYHYPSMPYHMHASPSIEALDGETRFNNVAFQPGTVVSPAADTEHQLHPEAAPGRHKRSESVDPVISGNDATPHSSRANADSVASAFRPRIILIGDSAGGNLVLALSRWIRDEGVLPVPDGMLLLSPSCDPCMHHLCSGPPKSSALLMSYIFVISTYPSSGARLPSATSARQYGLPTRHPRAARSAFAYIPRPPSHRNGLLTLRLARERVGALGVPWKNGGHARSRAAGPPQRLARLPRRGRQNV